MHEMKYSSCDTLLEFDTALNELMSVASESVLDDVLGAFPRLSNSCVENEASGGDIILLGVQERWVELYLGSKTLVQSLKEKSVSDPPGGHSMFDVLRAMLKNFEHIILMKNDYQKVTNHCENLVRIIDGVLKLLTKVRERKQSRITGRMKKRKEASGSEAGFVLIWDDPATKKLFGDRTDCVW